MKKLLQTTIIGALLIHGFGLASASYYYQPTSYSFPSYTYTQGCYQYRYDGMTQTTYIISNVCNTTTSYTYPYQNYSYYQQYQTYPYIYTYQTIPYYSYGYNNGYWTPGVTNSYTTNTGYTAYYPYNGYYQNYGSYGCYWSGMYQMCY